MESQFKQRLGSMLFHAGKIDKDQLEKSLQMQKEDQGYLGQIFLSNGYISEEGILREGVKINAIQLSADKEYMRAHYTVDGEDREFFTRYPWKSMPQRKYEEHVIGASPHPLDLTP